MPDVLDEIRTYWSDVVQDLDPPSADTIMGSTGGIEAVDLTDRRRRRRPLLALAVAAALILLALVAVVAVVGSGGGEDSTRIVTEPDPPEPTPDAGPPATRWLSRDGSFTANSPDGWAMLAPPADGSGPGPEFNAVTVEDEGASYVEVSVIPDAGPGFDYVEHRYGAAAFEDDVNSGTLTVVEEATTELGGQAAGSLVVDLAGFPDPDVTGNRVWAVWTVRNGDAYVFEYRAQLAQYPDHLEQAGQTLDSIAFVDETAEDLTFTIEQVVVPGTVIYPELRERLQQRDPGGEVVEVHVGVCLDPSAFAPGESVHVAQSHFMPVLGDGSFGEVPETGRGNWSAGLGDSNQLDTQQAIERGTPDCVGGSTPVFAWVPEGARIDALIFNGTDPATRIDIPPTAD